MCNWIITSPSRSCHFFFRICYIAATHGLAWFGLFRLGLVLISLGAIAIMTTYIISWAVLGTELAFGWYLQYVPTAQFCQGMEEEFGKFAEQADIDVYKFRGDEEREFVQAELNTESFPTVNVVKADGTVVKYDSEVRTVEAFNKFVEETIGAGVN